MSEQSFTAATPDNTIFVRVALAGHTLGVQIEPAAMKRPAAEIAQRGGYPLGGYAHFLPKNVKRSSSFAAFAASAPYGCDLSCEHVGGLISTRVRLSA